MDERFECCFENEWEGYWLTAQRLDTDSTTVSLVFGEVGTPEVIGEICLREDEVDRLIHLLHKLKTK